MRHVGTSIEVAAPAAAVWPLLAEVSALGTGRSRVGMTVAWPAAPYVPALHLALRNIRRLAEQRR